MVWDIGPATLKLDFKKGTAPKPHPGQAARPSAPVSASKKGRDPVAGGSWWAARAQSGEVAPGFSKDEILRPAAEDPRAEDGVFARVSGLLRELSGGRSIG